MLSGVSPGDPYTAQLGVARRFEEAEAAFRKSLVHIRIALLASSTVEHFVPVLRCWLARSGFWSDVYVAPFDTIEKEIVDETSGLYAHKPDVAIIFQRSKDILDRVPALDDISDVQHAAEEECSRWLILWDKLISRTGATIVHSIPVAPVERPLGNREASSPRGSVFRLNATMLSLMGRAPRGVYFFDLAGLASSYGLDAWYDPRYWFHSKHDFAFDAYGIVAHALARTVAGIRGSAKKVCVLDLDNTLWGGVVGDDGVDGIRVGQDAGAEGEAFTAFQQYLKSLKNSGVILAVCSKNAPEIAKEPFLRHSGMVLKQEDFTVFEANWDDKPDNLRTIARKLNVGFDSMVFIDDNPVERDFVKRALPGVTVVDMPDDPALYIPAVSSLRLFEQPRVTDEDVNRTAMMQAEQERQALRESPEYATLDLPAFLQSLKLTAASGDVDAPTLVRATQLINKTNQFSVNGVRLTEEEVQRYSSGAVARRYSLSDRFGEYGLVSVVLARAEGNCLIVDAWVLSCRVFQRSLEEFVLRDLVECAARLGCSSIVVRYVPTDRNGVVPVVLEKLLFVNMGEDERSAVRYRYMIDSELPRTFVGDSAKGENRT